MQDLSDQRGISRILLFTVISFVIILTGIIYYIKPSIPDNLTNKFNLSSVTASPSLLPSPTATPPVATPSATPKIGTYTSSALSVSFTYPVVEAGVINYYVLEKGNRICISDDKKDTNCDKGQYVEVYSKTASQSLEDAISSKFLVNYSDKDCFVEKNPSMSGSTGNFGYPSNYQAAIISFPQSTDSNSPWWANANKCPAVYTTTNSLAYFLMDTNNPTKYFYFKLGQYGIMVDEKTSWAQTIKIVK